jgi:hypothetical protein
MHAALVLSWSPTIRSAITIGFIGGLTTYSSINYEATRLLEEGAAGAATLDAGVTIVGPSLPAGSAWCAQSSCLANKGGMRVLDGNQFLVRIFLGESDRFHHSLLLERCSSGYDERASRAQPSSTGLQDSARAA